MLIMCAGQSGIPVWILLAYLRKDTIGFLSLQIRQKFTVTVRLEGY